MARVTATAGFGEASDYESVRIDVDASDVTPEYIPAVTREVPVMLDGDDGAEPVQATDPDTGAPLTKTEIVSAGRVESLEEALRKLLVRELSLDEIERSGLTNLRFTVSYSVAGEVELEFDESDLEDFAEQEPDEVDSSDIMDAFEDAIQDAVKEDIQYGYPEFDLEVTGYDAE